MSRSTSRIGFPQPAHRGVVDGTAAGGGAMEMAMVGLPRSRSLGLRPVRSYIFSVLPKHLKSLWTSSPR